MGKAIRRILLGLVLVVLIAVIGGYLYVTTALPSAGEVPELSVEITPERIERGEYLANHVYACMSCHSERSHNLYAQPVKKGTLGKGGHLWDESKGLPGKIYAPNITPYALEDWTDGEIFHAITAGVSRDGRALFPLMPHHAYGTLDPEDFYDIIAYIRTLEPIEHEAPLTELNFPMNLIVNMIPSEPTFNERPDPSDPVAFGEYLTKAASCGECHTPLVDGRYDKTRLFAGGNEYPLKDGSIVRSANITPHEGTGIGGWSENMFIQRFKMYADSSYEPPIVPHKTINTEMPWNEYSAMSEKELRAIWAYIQTIPPIKNQVVRYTAEPKTAGSE